MMHAQGSRTYASVIALLALFGCAPNYNPSPPMLACAPDSSGRHPSSGLLTVLPSEVPGFTLDSASWQVQTSDPGHYLETYLGMTARITATVNAPLDGIAVLFQSRRDSVIVYQKVVSMFFMTGLGGGSTPESRVSPGHAALARIGEVAGGVNEPPRAWGCPSQARIVWRR